MRIQCKFLAGVTIFLLNLQVITHVKADYVSGKEMYVTQPDQSKVKVIVWADEFYSHLESPEGYALLLDPATGWVCYAAYNEGKTDLISTHIRYSDQKPAPRGIQKGIRLSQATILARREAAKEKSANKNPAHSLRLASYGQPGKIVQGTFQGLTLLVDFSDSPATIPQANINNFFNQTGYTGYGNNGSVKDYFYAVSSGKLTYTNHVTSYYRAAHPREYYHNPNQPKTRDLIIEALENLKAQGFNFNSLTLFNNEIVGLNIFYAGDRPVSSGFSVGGLWPHKEAINYNLGNGVIANVYQITDITSSPYLKTVCHENGHSLMGWPDLYDRDGSSNGLSNFCLMASGGPNTNPVPPNPYLRALAGWETPVSLNGAANNSIHTANAGVYTSFKFSNPAASTEFFMIENIQNTGRWAGMPDVGLAVWHIDELAPQNDNEDMTPQLHYQVSLEQADGKFDLENNVDDMTNDLFHGGSFNAFGNVTIPSSKWWDGSTSHFNITNISNLGNSMTFKYVNTSATTPTWTIYEAENASLNQAVVESNHAGYTGTGFVNTNNVVGSYIEFVVNVPSAGNYNAKWRFANGTTTSRPAEIRVNGAVAIASQPGPGTSTWSNWTEASFTLPLVAGNNLVRFVSTTSAGTPNVDRIEVQSGSGNLPPVNVGSVSPVSLYQTSAAHVLNLSTLFSDPEGDFMFFSSSSSNPSVVETNHTSASSVSIVPNWSSGTSTITLKATDLYGNFVTRTVAVTVLPNEAPVTTREITNKILCTSFGNYQVDLDTCFSDADGDAITYSVTKIGSAFNAVIGTGNVLTLTPLSTGVGELSIVAKDNKEGTNIVTIQVKSRTSNGLPSITSAIPDQIIWHSETKTFRASNHYSDPENDVIYLQPINLNSNLSYSSYDVSEAELTPAVVSSSQFLVRFKISDNASCGTVTPLYDDFLVTISQNHEPQVASLANRTVSTGQSTVINLATIFSDQDGHAISYDVYPGSAGEQLATSYVLSGSTLTITGFQTGTDNYYVIGSDGHGMSGGLWFDVIVASGNQPPIVSSALPDRTLTQGTSPVTTNLNSHFSDPNGHTLTYSITSGSNSNVSISGSTLTVNPTTTGTWQVQVQAADGNGGTVSDIFQLTVNAAPASLCFEAESASGQSQFSPFQVLSDANASGGQYIVVPNGQGNFTGTPSNAIAAIAFNVATTATYNIWLRVLAPTSNDNNMYIKLDATSSYSNWTPGTYTSWTWKKWTSRSITAGSHTLFLARQEDGLQIDKVLLIQSSSTPTGSGCGSALREEVMANEVFADMTQVMPNPVTDRFDVAVTLHEASQLEIELINSMGESAGTVYKGESESGEFVYGYTTTNLPTGVYILKVTANGVVTTKTLVKH